MAKKHPGHDPRLRIEVLQNAKGTGPIGRRESPQARDPFESGYF